MHIACSLWGKPTVTDGVPSQTASKAEKVSMSWPDDFMVILQHLHIHMLHKMGWRKTTGLLFYMHNCLCKQFPRCRDLTMLMTEQFREAVDLSWNLQINLIRETIFQPRLCSKTFYLQHNFVRTSMKKINVFYGISFPEFEHWLQLIDYLSS